MRTYASYQVEVTPAVARWQTADATKEMCEGMVAEIKRHVDNVWDAEVVPVDPVCAHCWAPWTEDNPRYNGGCCKAEATWAELREGVAMMDQVLIEFAGRSARSASGRRPSGWS